LKKENITHIPASKKTGVIGPFYVTMDADERTPLTIAERKFREQSVIETPQMHAIWSSSRGQPLYTATKFEHLGGPGILLHVLDPVGHFHCILLDL